MRRLTSAASFALLGSLTIALAGCPIWGGHDDYYDDSCRGDCCYSDCCYDECYTYSCVSQLDCAAEEVCGSDNQCHQGDCESWGCPVGEVCDVTGFEFECVAEPGQGGSGAGGAGAGGAGGAGAGGEGGVGGGIEPTWCGNPDDCAAEAYCAPDGTCTEGDCSVEGCIYGFVCDTSGETALCVRENPNGCGADVDCASVDGASCISGVCTTPEDKCFDGTQCPSGDVCADGKCVPSCAGGDTCPASYTCTAAVELCTTPATACTITSDCGGPDSVCVDGACVPRSVGGICDPGSVWVENGCIPDQSAYFVCEVDGSQDVCASGSICLHHSCYISCAPPDQTACEGLPEFDVCKDVTTSSGAHQVCGSDDNLGSECDPTQGLDCAPGFICVDGNCK